MPLVDFEDGDGTLLRFFFSVIKEWSHFCHFSVNRTSVSSGSRMHLLTNTEIRFLNFGSYIMYVFFYLPVTGYYDLCSVLLYMQGLS